MLNKFNTFYRYIIDEERKLPDATGQLSDLLADIQRHSRIPLKLVALKLISVGQVHGTAA